MAIMRPQRGDKMLKLLLTLPLMLLTHLHDRPDLDAWAKGLKSAQGTPCCENDEAHALNEPDWRVTAEGHYQVFLEGGWWDVPDTAVVHEPNKYGRVLVWYVAMKDSDGHAVSVYVRCFLPAAGA
jgi:hypothetical protein